MRLIDLGERSPEVLYNAGADVRKSRADEKAMRLYRDALAQKPEMPEALLNLGRILEATGKSGRSPRLLDQGAGRRTGPGAGLLRTGHRVSASRWVEVA